MSCLDNIISVRDACNEDSAESLSGLDLFDAPEISISNIAKIANETYVTGLALARAKVSLAAKQVKTDLMQAMAKANVLPNILDTKITTGPFKPDTIIAAEAVERGVTLFRNEDIRGKLRKTIIHNVYIYAAANANNVPLLVYDDYAGGTLTTYEVDLIGGQAVTANIEYTILGTYARVVMNGENIVVSSAYLNTCAGCAGKKPNDCAYTKSSYNGVDRNGKEGYGIELEFSCKCDYDEFLCALASNYLGNIVWLKARILLMEECLRTNRLNNWTIYGTEDLAKYKADVEGEYNDAWKTFQESLPNILKQFKDSCLDCRGVRWVSNI